MPAEIELRRATADDAPTLCQLNRAVQELHAEHAPALFKPWRDEAAALSFFAGLLTQTRNHFELAHADGVAAGYVWWSLEQRSESTFRYPITRLYVHHIAVEPSCRRRGVGRALLEAAVVRAREQQ